MRPLRRLPALFGAVFLLPLGAHAGLWSLRDKAHSWASADWGSAGRLPAASAKREAMVHVYAARVGRWRGMFAHHSWIVVKEKGAARYTRYDVTGWGRPVKVDYWAPDARWHGFEPELVGAVEGKAAEALIPRVRRAVAGYPHNGHGAYHVWPGPNSNTFVAHVLAAIPEAQIALPPTAIGKDWRTDGRLFGPTPSGTGWQLSLAGLLGVTLAWTEGLELNVLGLVAGLDLQRPALKLPGFGRVGLERGPG